MTEESRSEAEATAERWIQRNRGLLTSVPADLWRGEAMLYGQGGRGGYRRYTKDSRARADVEAWSEDVIDLLLTRSHDALMGVWDHMAALDRSLAEPPGRLLVAPWAIARTVLEAEARVSWLLEPGTSGISKVSRAILLSLKDTEWGLQVEQRKAIAQESTATRFADRMRHYRLQTERMADSLGIPFEYERRFHVQAIQTVGDEGRPTITDVVSRMLEGIGVKENYYSMLSEISHQNSLAKELTQIEMMPAILLHVISCFSAVTIEYFRYCGLSCDPLVPVLEEAWAQAEFPESTRFWTEHRFGSS